MSAESVKFLVVDDVEENLVALEALLRRDGLEILKARSGPEALELLLVHDVALAFLDVQMPEMGGFELAELMRGSERTKNVPIIFLTAGARDPKRVFKGYETGAVDFLFKPVEPHVLKGKADVFFELYRQRRELSNALRLNEMFVGILGHDLRNPLSAIMMGAKLVERQAKDDLQKRAVTRMVSAGERMTEMIEQLLDLTRARLADGLGFVRVRTKVDVADLVQRAVDELRATHPDRDVLVDVACDCETTGDAERLLQLFSNVMANALLHGTPGSPVRARIEGDDGTIAVKVKNRGVIPAWLLPTIFDPFRGRQNKSSKSRGLGLGLFISQQIAIAHGGSIAVDSTEETGETAFTIRLPRRKAAAKPAAGTGGPKRILIVDDDEDVRDALVDALLVEGYEPVTASNGQAALEAMQEGPRPDLIILDLVLPVLDGKRVYEAMQADPALADIPVIVSTAIPERAPLGVIVVPKPLKLDHLLKAIAESARKSPVPRTV